MISVQVLGGGADAAGYYLHREGCEPELDPGVTDRAGYYLDGHEPVGIWAGRGAAALGLSGGLDAVAGGEAFRRLLSGRDPVTGKRLVAPVFRAPASSRLLAAPLVDAVRTAAAGRGVGRADLLGESAGTFARLEQRLDHAGEQRADAVTISPDLARGLATAAGLDVVEVYRAPDGSDGYGGDGYGGGVFARAAAQASVRVDVRRSGIDVTVSAPKSVSVIFGLADPAVSREVRAGHERAVRAALTYLEHHASHGLRGHQGGGQRAAHISTEGLIGAAFTHQTSRAHDPQLHTHLVIANLVHGSDGRWSALDSRALHRHAPAASYVYQATLRAELTRRLGIGWTPVSRGIAEVIGVPLVVREQFSTRRHQIEAVLGRLGRSDRRAAQYATLATRPRKTHAEETSLRERWRARVLALGHDPTAIVRDALDQASTPELPDLEQLREVLVGPTGLTADMTSVDARDVLQAICELLPAGCPVSVEQLEIWTRRILTESDEVLPVARRDPDGLPRYTTRELLVTEARALRLAAQLRARTTNTAVQAVGTASTNTSETSTSAPSTGPGHAVTDMQQQVLTALTCDRAGLVVMTGPAGAGKTAVLAHAQRAWQQHRIEVRGAAVAALAARGLQRATGIPSTTLVRLLADLENSTGATPPPAPGSVLVVDEAGMVDTRTLARLLEHAHEHGLRLVLVGDPAQLPEIGAGGLFARLAQHPATVSLTGNVRQQQPWERDALTALRSGDVETALAAYACHDRLHAGDDPLSTLAGLVRDYLHHANGGADVLVLTPTRADAAQLNRLIHTGRRLHHQLGDAIRITTPEQTGVEFAVGDRLLITRNQPALGLANGTRATLTDIGARTIRLRTDDGVQLAVPHTLLGDGQIQHGYACTIHKAQGQTVDIALVHGTSGLSAEAGYVALSRARTATHLYTSRPSGREHAEDGKTDRTAAVFELGEQLRVRRAHTLATEQQLRYLGNDQTPRMGGLGR